MKALLVRGRGALLTPEKQLRERALFGAFIYDVILLPLAFVVAVKSGSLTMLAEVLRGVFLVSMAIVSWFTLRRIHRGRTGQYDFGLGKLEQVLSVLVALALCGSIGFVWYEAWTEAPAIPQAISFVNFAAVGLTFLNLCANALPLPGLYKALQTGKSVLVHTQFRAKLAKSACSVVTTVCVAINQLDRNPDIAAWADRIGIMAVTAVTLHAVYELLRSAIPDLLDRTLPEDHQLKINQILARNYDDFEQLAWCRSRQSGSDIEVHVGLGFRPDLPFGRVSDLVKAVAREIESGIPGSRAIVTPVAHEPGVPRPQAGDTAS